MLHIVLILLCGLLPLLGAAAILWFLIHLWVAFRMDAKLGPRDYSFLGAGIFAIIIGIAGLNFAARNAPPLNAPAHDAPATAPAEPSTQPKPVPST
jgi:hypothetical protein